MKSKSPSKKQEIDLQNYTFSYKSQSLADQTKNEAFHRCHFLFNFAAVYAADFLSSSILSMN